MQLRQEIRRSAAEIEVEPARRIAENGRFGLGMLRRKPGGEVFRALEPESGQTAVVCGKQKRPKRGCVMLRIDHQILLSDGSKVALTRKRIHPSRALRKSCFARKTV